MLSVSVILVVQNGEKYLKSAIESVMKQSHQPEEIIVVDGISTDKTATIARSFNQVSYLKQSGVGLANARNTGIDYATGDLIAFLDYDDQWTADKLKIQINHFITDPDVQYSFGCVKLFAEPGFELRPGYTKSSFAEPHVGRTPGTLMVRKSFLQNGGEFKPEYKIGCDFEWFTRVKDLKIPYVSIPQILLLKRIHHSNLSNNVETNRNEILKVIKQSLNFRRKEKMPGKIVKPKEPGRL